MSRPCLEGGVWGAVDLTTCTLTSDFSLPFLIVSFTLIDPDSELPFAPLKEEAMSPFDSDVLIQEVCPSKYNCPTLNMLKILGIFLCM